MIHKKENIALSFAFHAEDYHERIDRVFNESRGKRKEVIQDSYLHDLLQRLEYEMGHWTSGPMHMKTTVKYRSGRPVIRIHKENSDSLCEPGDVAFVVTYVYNGKVVYQSMVIYRLVMNFQNTELWHIPYRQVDFLSDFPSFQFGDGPDSEYHCRLMDRFSGNVWFVNKHGPDFILSALALRATGKKVIKLGEIQERYRYRSEVAIVRHTMARLGDHFEKGNDWRRFYGALSDFVNKKDPKRYEHYTTRKPGKTFYLVESTLSLSE